jgi:hypothetical protein
MAIPARWWLCPDCLNGFDDQPSPPWHWADDECQGRCNGVPIEVVPADHPRGAVSADELEELRRFKAWALRDEPEYVKANATLKHRVRELEAELATARGAVSDREHWLATINGCRPVVVQSGDDIADYREQGWTVTGPYVPAAHPRGAV